MSFFETGPTAWLAPAYPYLLAGIFKIWGIYTVKSHIVSQVVNCLFASLTVFPIYGIARRSFGRQLALFSSWLWVALPNAWHIPMADIWDTSLFTFWCALTFWATLVMRERRSLTTWAGYGALWAAGAMINPAMLSLFPFLLGWLVLESKKSLRPCYGRALVAFAIFVIGIAPWTIRNYRTFHELIPVRSAFGIAFWEGNNPVAVGANHFALNPNTNLNAAQEYKRLGEIDYSQAKQREALTFMRAHPVATVLATIHRIGSFWFDVSDRPYESWSTDPGYVKMLLVLNAVMVLAAWFGVAAGWRSGNVNAAPYALILLLFSVVYYVTFPLVRYRFPIDPFLTILAVYGASAILAWTLDRQPWLRSRMPWIRAVSTGSDD